MKANTGGKHVVEIAPRWSISELMTFLCRSSISHSYCFYINKLLRDYSFGRLFIDDCFFTWTRLDERERASSVTHSGNP